MRLVMAFTLLLGTAAVLAGCDRKVAEKGQAEPAAVQKSAPSAPSAAGASQGGKKQDISLASDNGLRAVLSYKFAGSRAPDVAFAGADGRPVKLGDFAGRPLLLNLWATWCAPCKAEMPALDRLALLDEGRLTVVAVSQDLQGRKAVTPYFVQAGIRNLEPYTDADNRLLGAYGSSFELPTSILYDSQGREVWRVWGGAEWDDSTMEKLLAEAS